MDHDRTSTRLANHQLGWQNGHWIGFAGLDQSDQLLDGRAPDPLAGGADGGEAWDQVARDWGVVEPDERYILRHALARLGERRQCAG